MTVEPRLMVESSDLVVVELYIKKGLGAKEVCVLFETMVVVTLVVVDGCPRKSEHA